MRSIAEIIKDTVSLIENAPGQLTESIREVEQSIWRGIGRILSSFDVVDGKFSSENATEDLADIDERVAKSFSKAALKRSVDDYKINFNLVDDLTQEYYEATLRQAEVEDLVEVFKATRLKKTKIINDLDLYILNKDVFAANVLNEIRDEIFEAVILGSDVQELQDRLRRIIITEDGSNSKLLRYTRQIATDTLGEYNGTLQEKAREQYQLDKMTYSGSIVDGTRQFCYDLLLSKGRYERFAIRRGVYRVADLPEILELSTQCVPHHTKRKRDGTPVIDCGNGLKPNTTVDNFAQNRGGYNCDEQVFYSRLTARDLRIAEEKGLV